MTALSAFLALLSQLITRTSNWKIALVIGVIALAGLVLFFGVTTDWTFHG